MQYKFQHVFDEYTSQKAIFDYSALPLVEDLLKGKNGGYHNFHSHFSLLPCSGKGNIDFPIVVSPVIHLFCITSLLHFVMF